MHVRQESWSPKCNHIIGIGISFYPICLGSITTPQLCDESADDTVCTNTAGYQEAGRDDPQPSDSNESLDGSATEGEYILKLPNAYGANSSIVGQMVQFALMFQMSLNTRAHRVQRLLMKAPCGTSTAPHWTRSIVMLPQARCRKVMTKWSHHLLQNLSQIQRTTTQQTVRRIHYTLHSWYHTHKHPVSKLFIANCSYHLLLQEIARTRRSRQQALSKQTIT